MIRKIVCCIAMAAPWGASMAASAPVAIGGNWTESVLTDPITDEQRGILRAESGDGTLVLKCDRQGSGSVYVHLLAKSYLGGDFDEREMTYRFDTRPPVTNGWRYKDHGAIRMKPMQFILSLRTASKVTFRAERYDHLPVDIIIPVNGAAQAVQRVYELCGDTLEEFSYALPPE